VIVRIDAGGRTRAVDVQRRNNGFVVSIDGHEHTVDVSEVAGIWSLLIGPHEVGAGFSRPTRSYEVAFVEEVDGAMMVHVNGQAIPVSVESARRAWGARGRGARAGATGDAAGPHRIVAPMPGKIVKVLVKPGDGVQPRQGLVVVEAMKMENELRSPKAGTVSEVRVNEGASVEAGAILVIVE
jgi:biotin carboxyl carrier protein